MTKGFRTAAAFVIAATVALTGSLAGAHDDPNPDGKNNAGKKCDNWWREGHAKDSKGREDNHANYDENTGHSEDHESGFDQGQTGPVYIHNHTGHYVVRGEGFYIEVIGGGGYNRDGNQGGYVQGEVDPAAGTPDVDFKAGAFAGTRPPEAEDAVACVSIADNVVGDPGERP